MIFIKFLFCSNKYLSTYYFKLCHFVKNCQNYVQIFYEITITNLISFSSLPSYLDTPDKHFSFLTTHQYIHDEIHARSIIFWTINCRLIQLNRSYTYFYLINNYWLDPYLFFEYLRMGIDWISCSVIPWFASSYYRSPSK